MVIAVLIGGWDGDTGPSALLAFLALYSLGMSFGWGGPLGAFLGREPTVRLDMREWWQRGFLKNTVPAVIFRGILWALPILPLIYWNAAILYACISIAVAFPVSAWIARTFDDGDKHQWEWMEVYRGLLNASILFALVSFAN